MRLFIIVLAIIVIVIGGWGLFSALNKAAPVSENGLILLTEDYPPITYRDENGKISGLAAEVLEEIMNRQGMSYRGLQLLKWDEAYDRAVRTPNTVLFSTERTPEREKLFDWVGPIGSNKTYFYAPKNSKLKIDNLDQAKKVGQIATCSSWFTEQYLKDQGFTNLQSFADPRENIKKLAKEEVDLSVFTDMTFPRLAQQAGYSPEDLKPLYQLMETQFYIAVSKGTDPNLAVRWQAAFEQIKADGTLARIYQKYVPEIEVPK